MSQGAEPAAPNGAERAIAPEQFILLQQTVLPVLTEMWLRKKKKTRETISPHHFLHGHTDPFQNCCGAESVNKSGCFIHTTATAHPPLHAVLVYEETQTGLSVSSALVSAVHLRRVTSAEVIHHSLG